MIAKDISGMLSKVNRKLPNDCVNRLCLLSAVPRDKTEQLCPSFEFLLHSYHLASEKLTLFLTLIVIDLQPLSKTSGELPKENVT